MTQAELWRPAHNFEGVYEVSNLGRVRSLPRLVASRYGVRVIPGKVRKLSVTPEGYQRVCLYPPGTNSTGRAHVTVLVHRLVALAFCDGVSSERCEVNHKDFNRSNNRAENLEWATPSENVQHSVQAGRWSAAHNSVLNPKKWKKLDLATVREIIRVVTAGEKTQYRVAKDLKVSQALVTRIMQNQAKYLMESPSS